MSARWSVVPSLPAAASILLVAILFVATSSPAPAQQRPDGVFYGKIGAGFSDYTGDFPTQNSSHPFDLQEFTRGSGFPFVASGELGYQFTSNWTLALALQAGNYPIIGYGGGPSGISDSYRYTPQLLGRYTMGGADSQVAPYLDLGVNATVGGDASSTSLGYGPSVGGGVDILLSRSLSFFLESRFNFTAPDDAIDGASVGVNDAITGPFDSVNQLLGFGLKVTFGSPTPPRVVALDGPTEVQTGKAITLTATVNEEAVTRPVRYQWTFGDGATGSGLTATHTFERPGTYSVAFSAKNQAGAASASTTVTVHTPSKPTAPQISSIDVTPTPATIGDSVRFRGTADSSGSVRYTWHFGDGTSAEGASAIHVYEAPGQYTARLEATNEAGTADRSVTVRVNERSVASRSDPEAARTTAEAQGMSGSWSLVVASMRRTEGAERMRQRYRNRLGTDALPVDVILSETRVGLRLRVVAGRFATRAKAREALQTHADALPSGAWIVQRR